MQVAITYGFGKYLRDIPNRRNIITMVIWGQVGLTFIAFAASLSKISFGITLLRLTSGKWKALVWSTSVTISVLAVPAAVISWVQCQPFEKGLDRPIPGTCFSTNIPQHYGMFMAGRKYPACNV